MSRRVSLPGAEELFRPTTSASPRDPEGATSSDMSTKLQVAESPGDENVKSPKHDEKVTFYCTGADLMDLERARLRLRADYGIAADRGRIVRAALAHILEDFEAGGDRSALLDRLSK